MIQNEFEKFLCILLFVDNPLTIEGTARFLLESVSEMIKVKRVQG